MGTIMFSFLQIINQCPEMFACFLRVTQFTIVNAEFRNWSQVLGFSSEHWNSGYETYESSTSHSLLPTAHFLSFGPGRRMESQLLRWQKIGSREPHHIILHLDSCRLYFTFSCFATRQCIVVSCNNVRS